jgi:hypothetical protein
MFIIRSLSKSKAASLRQTQVCASVVELASEGIDLHQFRGIGLRDLKPFSVLANVSFREVYVLDFGANAFPS